jgi:hypothetical protein
LKWAQKDHVHLIEQSVDASLFVDINESLFTIHDKESSLFLVILRIHEKLSFDDLSLRDFLIEHIYDYKHLEYECEYFILDDLVSKME